MLPNLITDKQRIALENLEKQLNLLILKDGKKIGDITIRISGR